MTPLLEFKQVQKSFKQKNVLTDLTFSVEKPQIVALLGANGAGKTTTINLILGAQTPTKGQVKLLGHDPSEPSTRQDIGCTPQNVEFPVGVKTKEILSFVHGHYKNPDSMEKMISQFHLSDFLDTKASVLSGGQKRRLALALAFVGNPKMIFLDEPTTGLDVNARKDLWTVVQEQVQQGKTIFLTTHYLEEIEQVADRILFLQHGQIHFDGSVSQLKQIASSKLTKVCFFCATPYDFAAFDSVENVLHSTDEEGFSAQVILETYDSDQLLRDLVSKQIPFQNLTIEKENLESAFLNLSKSISEK